MPYIPRPNKYLFQLFHPATKELIFQGEARNYKEMTEILNSQMKLHNFGTISEPTLRAVGNNRYYHCKKRHFSVSDYIKIYPIVTLSFGSMSTPMQTIPPSMYV